jgi:hypothetical protein
MYDAPRSLRWGKLLSIRLLVVLAFSVLAYAALAEDATPDNFARCLTKKGVTLYGAYWDPLTQAQLKTFGPAAEHLSYVECSAALTPIQTLDCDVAGITGYPTWRFKDGSVLMGNVSLKSLSRKAACPLPGAAPTKPARPSAGVDQEEGSTPDAEEEVLHLRALDK